jgi:hypothetical protein
VVAVEPPKGHGFARTPSTSTFTNQTASWRYFLNGGDVLNDTMYIADLLQNSASEIPERHVVDLPSHRGHDPFTAGLTSTPLFVFPS